MNRIFQWFFMWKMDPMSGFDIRLVFTLPPRDSTLQYKRCVHFWNNFPCLTSLVLLTTWVRRGYFEAYGRILPPFLAEGCINIQIRNKWCCRRNKWIRNLRHKVTKNIFCKIGATAELFKMWFTVYRKLELIILSNVCF